MEDYCIYGAEHPSYYAHPSGVECWDIIKYHDYCIGSAIKYLWRAGRKKENGVADYRKEINDLQKAIECIKKRIEMVIELHGKNEYPSEKNQKD